MFEQQDNSSYVNFYVEEDFPEHQDQDIDQYSNYFTKGDSTGRTAGRLTEGKAEIIAGPTNYKLGMETINSVNLHLLHM